MSETEDERRMETRMESIDRRVSDSKAEASKHQEDRSRMARNYSEIFECAAGMEVLVDLSNQLGEFTSSFQADKNGVMCPIKAAKRDGARDAVLFIRKMILNDK